ncbi:alpha/beta hydrolase family protein [Promethearchaeum syntrophicum]|uniref:Alpha/beta hydrolase family protein n=1 Tax=Promethearchaeum syntrophicum TaxID=2594042 RepID=A0A5B9D8R2_9ARCH|nr:alpha/beta fold hydrolase [Candidatus Prometheoarchaeum syntrophicum]QEE15016.1 Alpha/beta hydrolase family protein [Candidatus Prometheoarchaeum syntrophicum]
MENTHIESTLHDFYPQRIWTTLIHRIKIIWLLIDISFLVTLVFQNQLSGWILFITWMLFIGLNLVSFFLIFRLNLGMIATNWDNIEYTGLIKRDFRFITSNGVRNYAYIYYPENFDLESDLSPRKTIIGLHGWGSHHREMDRYCLPIIKKENYLYFTFDARGQGQTPGNKSDFGQIEDAREFLELVLKQPYVDKKNVVVVGMSLGAAKTAVVAYPHPNIKAVVMLSGPFDLLLTKKIMTLKERIIFALFGYNFSVPDEDLRKYSGINYFKPEGIILQGDTQPTPNHDRVLLLANRDDPTVKVVNTEKAIEKLQLKHENYRIFKRGHHCFEGNEYFVALEMADFIRKMMQN